MKSRTRKYRRLKPPLLNVAKSMGKWLPADDFLLIQSITQLNDLQAVCKLTKFSRKFTLKEVKERWFAILYDSKISRLIYKKMKKLHTDDMIRLKRLAPFSDSENQLLLTLDSKIKADNFFEIFLLDNRISFHESRTSEILKKQYENLKECCLLADQSDELEHNNKSLEVPFHVVQSRLSDDLILNKIEINENDEKDMNTKYENLLNEIKRTEADVFLWQALADKVTGRSNPFIEMDTVAVLFCQEIEYKMKKREILIGRCNNNTELSSTSSSQVDINLSLIKESKKISRIQCKICLVEDDLFYLFNKGNLVIQVDGESVLKDSKIRIKDKSLIEIDDINLLFLINYNNIAPLSNGHVV